MIQELARIMSPTDMLREMARLSDRTEDGSPRLTFDDIKELANDASAPPLVRICARQWVTAGMSPVRFRTSKDGKRLVALLDPEVGRAWERIADRLDGRPTQTVHVHRTQERTPQEIATAMSALLARCPELARMLPGGQPPMLTHEGGEAPQRGSAAGDDASSVFRPRGESCPGRDATAVLGSAEEGCAKQLFGPVLGSVAGGSPLGSAVGSSVGVVELDRARARRVRSTEF